MSASQPKPLVSVITSTWQRPRELLRAIHSVAAQTYSPIEHIVVTDGPELESGLDAAWWEQLKRLDIRDWPTFASLGRHWGLQGCMPKMLGCLMASGAYIAYLDDDDEYTPDHVAGLVANIERAGADLAYSYMDGPRGVRGAVPPNPDHLAIGQVLHRADLLRKAMWEPCSEYRDDWHMIDRWLQAGASYVAVPVVTYLYHYPHRCVSGHDCDCPNKNEHGCNGGLGHGIAA